MNNQLEKEGYILFRNVLTQKQLNDGLLAIKTQADNTELLDYNEFKINFIDKHFISFINKELGWNSIYKKFRFSNKSNSRDTSTFHSDIYNFTDNNIPIYTCLEYFDNAVLEVIPGSHKRNSNTTTNELHKNRKKLDIGPGDILLFNANLLHRGIFYKSGIHSRKLLQVFDIFPNQDVFDKYNSSYLTVVTNNSKFMNLTNNLSEWTSKNKNINENITYYHLWLVNNNIQYKFISYDSDIKQINYVGYIPGNIEYLKPNKLENWNVNIYVMPITNMTKANYYKLYLLLLLLILIWIGIYNRNKILKKKNKKLK